MAFLQPIDHFFKISDRASTFGREIRGGFVTFFAMAYIIVLNPIILGSSARSKVNVDINGHYLPLNQVASATALAAGVLSIIFGLLANYPFVLAAGLGINSLLTTSVITKVSWSEAMGLVVVDGIIIVLLAASGVRAAMFRAIPSELKSAISVGIGCFICFVGFVDSGFVHRIPDIADTTVPVAMGQDNSIVSWPTLVFVLGILIIGSLVVRKIAGGFLIGIILTTIIALIIQSIAHRGASPADPRGWGLNIPAIPHSIGGHPDLSLLGKVDIWGAFHSTGFLNAIVIVFTLVLSNFFDAMGTMSGLAREANLEDGTGNVPGISRALLLDGCGAMVGGFCSVSSNTVFSESATGIAEGARTGLASIVAGVLFLLAMFFTPIYAMVPQEAATPALVIVGAMLMTQIRNIDMSQWEKVIPVFLTIIVMPYTYSIANGIGVGFISWVFFALAKGKAKTIHPILWMIAILFILYFAKDTISAI